MNLISLVIKNFFSYKSAQISFSNEGIYIIHGEDIKTKRSNGSGKSTIKEAIKYVFFNKCRLKSVDDAIHFNERELIVQAHFLIGNDEYKIERSRVRNSKTSVIIYKNGQDITLPNLVENDNLIEKIIGIDYEKFMRSFCFGQSEFDDLKTLTPVKLIEFLKSALRLDRFDRYLDVLNDIQTKNNSQLDKLLGMKEVSSRAISSSENKKIREEIKNLEAKLGNKKRELNSLKVKYEKESNELNDKLTTYNITIKNVESLEKKLSFIEKNNKCPTCKTQLKNSSIEDEFKRDLKKYEKERDSLQKVILPLKQKKNKFFDEIEPTLSDSIYDLQEKIAGLKEKIKQNKNIVDIKKIEQQYKKAASRRGIILKTQEIFNAKGLPLYVLNLYLPKLENIINQVLGKLIDFKVCLKTQKLLKGNKERRNTCEIVLMKGERECSLESLSSGEEFLVTLAIRIGVSWLYNVNNKFETLIVDEGFGKLDSFNLELVLCFIDKLKRYFKKILIISHVDEVKDFDTENKIFVRKRNDVSYLKESNCE